MRALRAVLVLMCAGLASLAVTARARAAGADSILVRVGGNLAGRLGQTIDVPITVDLSGAPGRQLGSYRSQLTWNPALLELVQITAGNFAAPQYNTGAAGAGSEQITAVQPSGASGVVTVYVAQFYVLSDTAPSPITVAFDEMSATATSVTPFEILLPLVKYVQGTFCRSLGRWGDVNGDGESNSLDALVALSVVVGIAVDTTVMTPALADVDGDGQVTSRDALIMLSYGVGLPVTGFRVLLTAAGGSCGAGSGAAATLAIVPDSLELEIGQGVAVLAQASDATGRSVPVDSLAWTSSNPSIAAYDQASGQVKARAVGVATLTAQLGPGVQGTLKVSVLARRTTWYVDVQRALNAPVQTGAVGLPFQFIGDAVNIAQDGDTVLVASGTYEEEFGRYVSVVLLGDSVNPPVVDPRGAPYWSTYDDAIYLGSSAAPLVVANLVVKAGDVYLDAHDITARNLDIEGLSGTNTYAGLEIYSENLTPAPPARGGPTRSGAPEALGNVLVDGVSVTGDSLPNGIVVDLADTAVIRNSAATRTTAGVGNGCNASSSTNTGILIVQASVGVVQNNTVTNPDCQGIGVFDNPYTSVTSDVARANLSHNRVSGAPGIGVGVNARHVALDHNSVRSTVTGQSQCCAAFFGIEIVNNPYVADTVTSLGDTVVNVGGSYASYGLSLDTAVAAVVDSLVVDSVGSGFSEEGTGASGFYFSGRSLSLTNSRVANSTGDGIEAFGELEYSGRHNLVRNVQRFGIWVARTQCDCSNQPPDSVAMAHDSVVSSGTNGVEIDDARVAVLDSLLVDSANTDGLYLNSVARGTIRNSAARDGGTGIFTYFTDTLSLLGDTAQADFNGVDLEYTTDSVTISGGVMDGNAGAGIYLDYQSVARLDSVTLSNNGDGLYLYSLAGARVQRSRFQGNALGFYLSTSAGMSSSVTNSNFLGNTGAGVWNDAYAASGFADTLFADANFWNDPTGPTCDSASTGFTCPGATGDAIGTAGVTFAGWLSGAAPTPAPPLRPVYARATATRPAVRSAALAAAPSPPAASNRPRAAYRAAVTAPAAASHAATSARGQHAHPVSWHKAVRPQGIRISRKR